jgi:hypothetical protein
MNVSRRTFLSRSSLGLALAGALAAVPGLATLVKLPLAGAVPRDESVMGETLVAHVRDMNSGEISLMVGTNRVIRRDVDLAARLYAAARRSS